MKSFVYTLTIIFFVLASCEGDQGPIGPEGPPGPAGADGGIILPQVFEVEVDFLEENDFALLFTFPEEIEVFDSDVVTVYHFAGVDTEIGADIWEAMPHIIYFSTGIISYSFDHTLVDINFYIDGNVDLTTLTDEFTLDNIFRVAVIPAEFLSETKDMSLNELIQAYNIEQIKTYNLE